MWSYKDNKIISAVPVIEIARYLDELGAVETDKQKYNFNGLTIEIVTYDGDAYPDIGIPRHTITVYGEKEPAEDFLTKFRFKFLSAGG